MLQLTNAHKLYITQLKAEHATLLKEANDKASQLSNQAATKDISEKKMKNLKSEIKMLKKKLKINEEVQRTAEINYQKQTELLKETHENELNKLMKQLKFKNIHINELEIEIKKLKKTMAKELSDKLAGKVQVFFFFDLFYFSLTPFYFFYFFSEKLADKAEALDAETIKLKKDILHYKNTIKEQIDRLKKIRAELKTEKETTKEKELHINELTTTIKKLKQKQKNREKMMKENQKKENVQQNENKNDQKLMDALKIIETLKATCNNLSTVVTEETKSSGYLSNLNVLIKTAEGKNIFLTIVFFVFVEIFFSSFC